MSYNQLSPCIGICKLENDVCVGCHRTLDQIVNWGSYSMEQRMSMLKEIQSRLTKEEKTTHDCPECGSKTYCAIEDGHSPNLCWCMYVDKSENPTYPVTQDKCLCKGCLCDEQ